MTNTQELLHIPSDEMPTGLFSVDIAEPTFKERVEATKRVPENSNMGYSMPQLMLSMCLKKVANKKVTFQNKDPIANIRPMGTRDQQFIVSVFTGAFFLDEELVEDVKSLANELRGLDKQEFYTIPSSRIPSGTVSVSFKTPSTGNQIDLDRRYPGNNQQVGYSFEEFYFANLITHINGEEVDKKVSPIDMLQTWSNLDVEYAVAVFLQMNFIDKEVRDKATELGKKWRNREPSTKKAASKSEDTMDSQQ